MYDEITNRNIFSAVQEYIQFRVTKQVLGPELASRQAVYSLLWQMPLYIFDILFLSPYMFV